MKILIAYYSRTNSTKELAFAVAKEFENRGHKIDFEEVQAQQEHGFWGWQFKRIFESDCDIVEPKIKDVSEYDAICVGSPNWTRLSLPMARYLRTVSGLKFKNIGFFSTTGLWPIFEWYIFSAYFLYVTLQRIITKKMGKLIEDIMVSSIFKKRWGTNSPYGAAQIKRLCDKIENPPHSYKIFALYQKEIERSRFLVTFFLVFILVSTIFNYFLNFPIFSPLEFYVFLAINLATLVIIIFFVQKKWEIYFIKYMVATLIIFSVTLPHFFGGAFGRKEFNFSEVAFAYVVTILFVGLWKEYKSVLLAGFVSLAGYYFLFLNKTDIGYKFFPTADIFVIVFVITIILFILRFANKAQGDILDYQDELENETKNIYEINKKLLTTTSELEKEKEELTGLKINLEKTVGERTKEFQKKVAESERFQELTVGRELKMIELKKELENLKKK